MATDWRTRYSEKNSQFTTVRMHPDLYAKAIAKSVGMSYNEYVVSYLEWAVAQEEIA